MLSPIGFWSYSNTDDDHSRGRLSQLRALLASELQQKIGRKLKVNIFQDVAAIPPGAEWEKQIRDAINGSFFLIPIVTPALLQSEWCCQEITLFRQREDTMLGRADLIFPLHYLNVDDRDPSRAEDCHDAEVFRFLRTRQWTDFRALRHKNPESEDVARKIDALADAICSGLRRVGRKAGTEDEPFLKATVQAQDRAHVDEIRREPETNVGVRTAQERSKAEAKRGEQEAKRRATDAFANEPKKEERGRREAAAEQERRQAALHQGDAQLSRKSDEWPAWLDVGSWPYFRIAVTTAALGLSAHFLANFLQVYGLRLGGVYFLYLPRALYAATVLLLVAPMTRSPKTQKLTVLFVGVYVVQFVVVCVRVSSYSGPAASEPVSYLITTLAQMFGILLEWSLITYAASLKSGFTDRNFLGIAAIVGAATNLVFVIFSLTQSAWAISAFQSCTSALLFTYGIRKQTGQVPLRD
jgi:hypothetical protein